MITLRPLAPEKSEHGYRYRCLLDRPDGKRELWYEVPESIPTICANDIEPFLIAVILDAMANQWPIKAIGSASRTLLSNLEEFQVCWNRWLPNKFHLVSIEATDIRSEASAETENSGQPTAVAGFTGGVDSTYSIWRHYSKQAGNRSQKIKACVLVHGFDISIDNDDKFEKSLELASKTLSAIDIKTLPIKTNFRDVIDTIWSHSHGIGLVSAMQFFKGLAQNCIISSSKPYDDLVLPYGSNPLSDILLSSGSFSVIHEGAGANRTEKVNYISQWETGVNNLRVCWKGKQTGANCGKCEKCTRTKMNFFANGLNPPKCLGSDIHAKDIFRITLPQKAVEVEFQQILETARKNKIYAPWVFQLKLTMLLQPIYRARYYLMRAVTYKKRHQALQERRKKAGLGTVTQRV